MGYEELTAEALRLPADQRARLAHALLETLDPPGPAELEQLWTEEALRRDAEMDADTGVGRPAEEVLRQARAALK